MYAEAYTIFLIFCMGKEGGEGWKLQEESFIEFLKWQTVTTQLKSDT